MADRRPVIVFFDLETGGLRPDQHPIIQIAAAVVSVGSLEILDELEIKVQFDTKRCTAEALAVNHYTPESWANAVTIPVALQQFAALCNRHAWIAKTSKAGKTYHVVPLAAYNASFDVDFLFAAAKRHNVFLAAEYKGLCVLDRVRWHVLERRCAQPPSYKLADVCAALGVEHRDAHDARGDNRAQIDVYRVITGWQPPEF